MLKIVIYSSQSVLGVVPMLHHIEYNGIQILFIQSGTLGNVTVHYIKQNEKPSKKFIELKKLSGEFSFVDKIGSDGMSLYFPILELELSTFEFP